MRNKLVISETAVAELNAFLADSNNTVLDPFFEIVAKHGTVDEINRKAKEAGKLSFQLARLKKLGSHYFKDLLWLIEQRQERAFISVADYRYKILGSKAADTKFDESYAVTLEISAFQYFPWLISEAKQAIEQLELLPGRYIRVRSMKEQLNEKNGDELIAVSAAMNIIGASYVETLDTRGTDGSNIHLGGPETITGYFGGVGQPNDYALKWLDEYLFYYTNYGIKQVLNINPGTVLLGYFLRKIGIDNEFKISVFMGNDNPYSILSTFIMAKLFLTSNGSSPLIGFNLSNSVNNETIEIAARIRKALGLEYVVRFEHHITEAYRGIVRQPYNRRDELVEVAKKVKNISAKHEGGEPETEINREHPSSILDYFVPANEMTPDKMRHFERNFLDKHDSVNATARKLTENGIAFVSAQKLTP
ncbi:MAG: hypothetical protein Q8R55_02630 [Candidatus Taylorbacteria bacterium]|nr:hypothetical protein [Candidatus Taylorbacteria bacterium]